MTRVTDKTHYLEGNWQDGLKFSIFIAACRNNIQLFFLLFSWVFFFF